MHCDGHVLVTDDLLGLNETNIRFVKKENFNLPILQKSLLILAVKQKIWFL